MLHEMTQGISQLKCFPNCCENKLTLVRLRVERIVPVERRVNLPILAGGIDGRSISFFKVHLVAIVSLESVQSTPQSSSLDELSGLARLAQDAALL